MEALDVVKYIGTGVGLSRITTSIYPLALKLAEETFGRCVVSTMPHVAHAADNVMVLQEVLVLSTGELRSAIRMQDDRTTIPQSEFDILEVRDQTMNAANSCGSCKIRVSR